MTNREKLIEAIDHCHPLLSTEITYQLEDVDHEDETYDIVSAFEDAAALIESEADWKYLFKYLKDLYIEIGYAVPVDIKTVHVFGGSKYWFIKNGKHYECIDSWSSWISK